MMCVWCGECDGSDNGSGDDGSSYVCGFFYDDSSDDGVG